MPESKFNPFYINPEKAMQNEAFAGAATAGLGFAGSALQSYQSARHRQQFAPQELADDQPMYQLGGLAQDVATFNPRDYGRGLTAQGAMAGASIGGAPGALIGGVVGLGAQLLTRGRAKREQRNQQDLLASQQQDFNQANRMSEERRLAMDSFAQTHDRYRMMGNLYSNPYA